MVYISFKEAYGVITELYTLEDDKDDGDIARRAVILTTTSEYIRPFCYDLVPANRIMKLLYF